MEQFFFEKTTELRKNQKELEEKLKVKIDIKGKRVTIDGEGFEEYEASIIMNAMSMGFSAKKALTLKDEGLAFVRLSLKSITKRKDLREVRARIIGKEGKTKRTIESVANCEISLQGNEVGIIGDAESIEDTKTAIANLIRGTKEANVYNFLEKMNTKKKELIYKK